MGEVGRGSNIHDVTLLMHLDATLLTFKGVVRWGSKVHDATLLTFSRNFQDALGLPKYARPRNHRKPLVTARLGSYQELWLGVQAPCALDGGVGGRT